MIKKIRTKNFKRNQIWNDLKKIPKLIKSYKLNLKYTTSSKLVIIAEAKRANKIIQIHNYKVLLRKRRIIKKDLGLITQKPIINIDLDKNILSYSSKRALFLNNNLTSVLKDAHKALYKNDDVLSAGIQALYITGDDKDPKSTISSAHTKVEQFNKDIDFTKLVFKVPSSQTGLTTIVVGYRIVAIRPQNIAFLKDTILNLKAYQPSSNRKFHEMTTASTPLDNLCIYNTFLDVTGKKELRYRKECKANHELIKTMLKNEGKEIEKYVKNGELIKSLCLLTKKYNEKILIVFYGSEIHYNKKNKTININGDQPILINNGEYKTLFNEEILPYIGKKCILYEKNIHVAPFIFNIASEKKVKRKVKNFCLRKKTLKTRGQVIKNILGYDVESYLDENENSVIYAITLFGDLNKEKIKKKFYGKESLTKFLNYIDEIKTHMYKKKTRPSNKIAPIFIYGYNNSNFDNLLIYDDLYERDRKTKFIFTNSSIKYIKYNNVSFYDISLFYKLGGLRKTAKEFKLKKEKGTFPYAFPNKDNLNYIGKVPSLKYWNSKKDYEKYIEKEGNSFNMKDYTLKYCLLDSELVYDMAKRHLKNCVGEINGRKFNTSKSPTSANLSIKMFTQVFQKENLYQSPDDIIIKETKAYKGGRTEVFKKCFNTEIGSQCLEYLFYVDINSSYPSGMNDLMPYKYLNTVPTSQKELLRAQDMTPWNLYLVRSEYNGNDKNVIPNLLIRDEKSKLIIAPKNTDYNYHWGGEVKEAILNGFDIYCKEVLIYEGKKIFDVFANYFYDERLKIKRSNQSLSLFYKIVMNSLYGKFGQRTFNNTKIVHDNNELNKILEGDMRKLVNLSVYNGKMMIEYKNYDDEYNSIGKLMRFASYISSTSRVKLSELMRDVGHENVYYCDTDSVFTSKKPNKEFLDENILGKWKMECAPIKSAVFLAPKLYYYETINNKVDKKGKGIQAKYLNKEDYENMLNDPKHKVERTSKMFFRSFEGVKIKDQSRNISCVYNKRIWTNNNSEAFENIEEWNLNNTG